MNKKIKISAGVIILATSVLIISSHWNDTPVVDEIPHIGAGYSYLVKQNMRLNPEHPPIAKDLAAIPLLFMNIERGVFKNPYWLGDITPTSQWAVGKILLYQPGNDPDNILHWARLPMLLFFLSSAILIFKWGYKLYGKIGAYTALILFSFSPGVLAHSGLVTTDIAALTGILFAVYFFMKYLKEQTNKNLIVTGLVLGGALLTKFSALLLIPFFILLMVIYGLTEPAVLIRHKIRNLKKRLLALLAIFMVALFIIVWPAYLFHVLNYNPIQQSRDIQIILSGFNKYWWANALVWMSDKPLLRAGSHYMLGFIMIGNRIFTAAPTYFLGKISPSGPGYFPLIYFLKEPLPWLILATTSILFTFWQLRFRKNSNPQSAAQRKSWIQDHFEEFGIILWLVAYWSISISSRLNIGIRHLLPIYPFSILLASGQLVRISNFVKRSGPVLSRLFFVCLISLLGWYLFESLRARPNYLSYFNQVAGGPSGGYRYVVDSNLDWGQDLKRFAQWVNDNSISKIELDYFGWASIEYYLGVKFVKLRPNQYKDAQDFVQHNQSNGWLAISATAFLQQSRTSYRWLDFYKPVAKIGNSIWVWHIEE